MNKIEEIKKEIDINIDDNECYGNYIITLPTLDKVIDDVVLLQQEISELRQIIAELETKINNNLRTYGPQLTPRSQSKNRCFPNLTNKN